jgi:hypothetical protein
MMDVSKEMGPTMPKSVIYLNINTLYTFNLFNSEITLFV